MSNIKIKTRSGVEHVMSLEMYTRWLCLVEAIDFIDKKAVQCGINLDRDSSWIKPLDIRDYINTRFPAMLHDVKVEESLDVEFFNIRDELQDSMRMKVSNLADSIGA